MSKKEDARLVLNDATRKFPRVTTTLAEIIDKEQEVPIVVTDPEVIALQATINNPDTNDEDLKKAVASLLAFVRDPDAVRTP